MKLSKAFRITADRIESRDDYNWGHPAHCNCGQLAQTVMSVNSAQLHALRRDEIDKDLLVGGYWTESVDKSPVCEQTGLPVSRVLRKLYLAGMTAKDIEGLEWLNHPVVAQRTAKKVGMLIPNYSAHVVAFMREWADMLDEQEQFQPTQLPESARQVKCVLTQPVQVTELS